MRYPNTFTQIRLYEQSDQQLRELAHEAARVAEPKKTRIAFNVISVIAAVTIIGLPIAFIIQSHRAAKNQNFEEGTLNKLRRLRDIQIRHHIQEETEIAWNGNAAPNLYFPYNGDTRLVLRAMRANPNCRLFNLDDLRQEAQETLRVLRANLEEQRRNAQDAAQDAVTLSLDPNPHQSEPPSYGAVLGNDPPPSYDDLFPAVVPAAAPRVAPPEERPLVMETEFIRYVFH